MNKVVVVGAGASGIIAALKASEGNEVILIEQNAKIGKKLLITGNGHANFWNKNISVQKYHCDNESFLNNVLSKQDEVYKYLTSNLGITPIAKDDYIYPYSKTASSIVTALSRALTKANVSILYDTKVIDVCISNKEVTLKLSDNTFLNAHKLILATGSKAAPKTGSDGSGYTILKKLGLQINPVEPSLVPLITADKVTKYWSGVRANAKLTIKSGDKIIREEVGEIQLTDYGLSGIITFNISSIVSSYLASDTPFTLTIDFMPDVDDLLTFLNEKNIKMGGALVEELLETIFNYKLLTAILWKANISKDVLWENLKDHELTKLITTIKHFPLTITATENFEKAQVCRGGVSLNAIDETFTLIKYPNIKVIGELLDVDGICGGYNLAFAFISGYIGGNIKNDQD